MPLTANINLAVPALPDNDTAFANNAAWQNYWANINVNVTFDGAANDTYIPSVYDNSLPPVALIVNAQQYNVPTTDMFNSLLAAYSTMEANYREMRDALKAAGILTNSQ
jgi:hypothetical protein